MSIQYSWVGPHPSYDLVYLYTPMMLLRWQNLSTVIDACQNTPKGLFSISCYSSCFVKQVLPPWQTT